MTCMLIPLIIILGNFLIGNERATFNICEIKRFSYHILHFMMLRYEKNVCNPI